MPEQTKVDRFLSLVPRVHAGSTPRSENDLSSRLAGVFEEFGLHAVVDTSVSSGSRKRPDVLAYSSEEDADLVSPAEVVVEAKKPEEIEGYSSLAEAIVSERYWHDKTLPYLRDNISRVRYFAFTTFIATVTYGDPSASPMASAATLPMLGSIRE